MLVLALCLVSYSRDFQASFENCTVYRGVQ